MEKQTTITNKFGEKIHIKLVDGEILVHHEDATNDFKPLKWVLENVNLAQEEHSKMYLAVKKMSFEYSLIYLKEAEVLF
jgi:hypothetical protein